MKHVARAGLAVALLVGFYLLAVGLAVGLVVALVQVLRLGFSGLPIAILFALVVPVVFAVLYGVFGRSRDGQPPGVRLTEQAQPQLWAVARELADLAETRCADEIRLVADANAAVSDSGSWLGLRAGTRRLYLGVPLLHGLDEAQLRSVLAHEFGHYGGRHTALAGVTYRGAETIGRTVSHLGPRHLASRLFLIYARLYFAVSHSVNRRQELEADQLSARAVGPDVAASALLEVAPLAVTWEHYLHRFAAMGLEIGRRPTGLLAGFADHLACPEVARAMQQLRETTADEKPSVYDTHPSTGSRVALLLGGAAPVQRRPRARRSACSQRPRARSPSSRTRCTTRPGERRPRCRSSLRWPEPTTWPAPRARSTRSCWSRAGLRASAPSTSRSATARPPGCCASWSPTSSWTFRR